MLREVAQSTITKIKEAWPDGVKKQTSLPSQSLSEPVGRGRPKKQAPPTQNPITCCHSSMPQKFL